MDAMEGLLANLSSQCICCRMARMLMMMEWDQRRLGNQQKSSEADTKPAFGPAIMRRDSVCTIMQLTRMRWFSVESVVPLFGNQAKSGHITAYAVIRNKRVRHGLPVQP